MKRRDLEQDIQASFDGGPVDEAALRKALLDDPAALDAWCDYALLDAELRRHSRGRLKVPGTVPAREEVKRSAHVTTSAKGGEGAVREVCELILKAKGIWPEILKKYEIHV